MKPRLGGSKGWNRVKAYHHLRGPKQIVLAQWTRPAHINKMLFFLSYL